MAPENVSFKSCVQSSTLSQSEHCPLQTTQFLNLTYIVTHKVYLNMSRLQREELGRCQIQSALEQLLLSSLRPRALCDFQ